VTIVLCTVDVKKAASFDQAAAAVLAESQAKGRNKMNLVSVGFFLAKGELNICSNI